MVRGGVTYRLVTDHLGSLRQVLNTSTGAIAEQIDYDEFGNVLSDSDPGFVPFGFAGGLYDAQTKLVRFGARDYEAVSGRWLVKDPIRFGGNDANLFVYGLEDPLNQKDMDGKSVSAIADLLDYILDLADVTLRIPRGTDLREIDFFVEQQINRIKTLGYTSAVRAALETAMGFANNPLKVYSTIFEIGIKSYLLYLNLKQR